MKAWSDYRPQEKLHQGERFVVYRAELEREKRSVVLKMPAATYPSPTELATLEHEYELGRTLDSDTVIQHLALIPHGQSCALVLEDFGARSLLSYLAQHGPLDISRFLELAQALARALEVLHRRNIIHKDICPENILYNPKTGQVKLGDLGMASVLSREKQEFWNPALIEGTLPYISPEQTGRMNRAIDYRSDFYALGATFYYMLTGAPPFETNEAIELVHCHIARTPLAPHVRRPQLPEPLSAIVLKLLAKNSEDRYQSAEGLLADLSECERRFRETGHIAPFVLCQHDLSKKFRISEKLYGRERPLEAILEAFNRAAAGRGELLLVEGYSGVGKSAVVREVHKPIAAKRGYFIQGKCNPSGTQVPLSVFTQVLTDLARQLLTESEERLADWRPKLNEAAGGNGKLLVDLVPALSHIMGEPPPVSPLPPVEARERFESTLTGFLLALAREEHPLVIFLDDLQWVDPGSLRILLQLTTAAAHRSLLLIGACRDNEITPAHPLTVALASVSNLTRVALSSLELEHVTALVADSLHCNAATALPLAGLLLDKTGGNPFFLLQFLHTLSESGLLQLDPQRRRWVWDLEQLNRQGLSENVVDFMVAKIKRYPPAVQQLLVCAGSLGSTFDLETISIIGEASPREAAQLLWDAVRDGIIVPADNRYNYFVWAKQDREDAPPPSEVRYHFAHDRIQEAALAQLPQEQWPEFSLRIGRLLQQKLSTEHRSERLFHVVNLLNLGSALMSSAAEKEELARLDLIAGRWSKAAAAYQVGAGYLRQGVELLPEAAWEQHYELMFALHRELIECEFFCGNLQEAEALFARTAKRARTRQHLGDIYQLMIRIEHTTGKLTEGMRLGQECLRLFNIQLPTTPADAQMLIGEKTLLVETKIGSQDIAKLADLPLMHDQDTAICLVLLHETWSCAVVLGDFTQVALTSLYMIQLSLEHGNSEYSACGYVAYGSILITQGAYARAYAFGKLAMALLEKCKNPLVFSKVSNTFANFINHFTNHIQTNLPIYQESYQYSLRSGDGWWGSWAATWQVTARLIQGDRLVNVFETGERYRDYVRNIGFTPLMEKLRMEQHFTLSLQGRTENRLSLSTPNYREETSLEAFAQVSFDWGIHWYCVLKALLHFLYEEHEQALAFTRRADEKRDATSHSMTYSDHFFNHSLILAAWHDRAAESERRTIQEEIETHRQRLAQWAEHCPANIRHKHLLVTAELARIEGRHGEAADLYEKAIESAREHGFLHHEAIANELAGQHQLRQGRPKAAKGYLQEACSLYSRWGASAKVAHLEARHPEIFAIAQLKAQPPTDQSDRTSSRMWTGQLDLVTVMKAAQALSSEIVLSRLLERIVRIGIENAGAQRGVLVLERNGTLLIEASASVEREEITVQQSILLEQATDLPQSIIKYVQRTGEAITLDDAASDPRFQNDPYIASTKAKSVVCLPSVRQAGRLGIFYLENNLVKGAFPPERIQVLKIISTQAAISLENALLYATLEERVKERTAQLVSSNEELSQTLHQLREAQWQLVQQEKLASLGALTAGIAHELKNPLNFVNNFSELTVELTDELRNELESRLGPEGISPFKDVLSDLRENVSRIIGHGKRADHIVQGMMEHARMSSGDKRLVDVNQLLTENLQLVSEDFRSQGLPASVEIDTNYDSSIQPVALPPKEFGLVILNIVNNACYAVNARKLKSGSDFVPRLQVSTREKSGWIEIRIRDNGMGIPQNIRNRLFTPFFTTKPPRQGTGLGLSISHQLIKGLGGSISFESEEGQFTEFIITLPRSP